MPTITTPERQSLADLLADAALELRCHDLPSLARAVETARQRLAVYEAPAHNPDANAAQLTLSEVS